MSLLSNAIIRVPEPVNEPQFDYAVDSEARTQLKNALTQLADKRFEIPLIIGGQEQPFQGSTFTSFSLQVFWRLKHVVCFSWKRALVAAF